MSSSTTTRKSQTITFITANPNKLSEVQSILLASSDAHPNRNFTLTSRSLDLVEIQAASVEEIASDKCQRAAEMVSCFFLELLLLFSKAKNLV